MYKREKVGYGPCPRCNAQGYVYVQKRKRTSHFWEQVYICPKCKYQQAYVMDDGSGPFMSDVQKRAVDRRRELMQEYDRAETPAERGRIMSRVRAIDALEKDWIASL